jgi:hypothetical protein
MVVAIELVSLDRPKGAVEPPVAILISELNNGLTDTSKLVDAVEDDHNLLFPQGSTKS